jgi:uncharacterized membrane protein
MKRIFSLYRDPAWFFLFFGLVAGILLIYVTPPIQAPDEGNHFYRAFQVSEGRMLSQKNDVGTGGEMPRSLVTVYRTFAHITRNPERKVNLRHSARLFSHVYDPGDRIFVRFENTAMHSPVPYLPQAAGIALGKVLDRPAIAMFYLGRVSNLIVSVLLIFLAICLTPVQRWLFVLIGLMPMTLFLLGSLSADAFTISLTMLLVALALRYALTQHRVSIPVMVVVSVALSVSKLAYIMLPMLFFIVPAEKLGGRLRKMLVVGGVVTVSVLSALVWSWMVKQIYTPPTWFNNINVDEAIRYVSSNPSEFFRIIFTDLGINWLIYLKGMIGLLGWMDTPLSNLFRLTYGLLLMLVAVASTGSEGVTRLSWLARGWVLLLLTGSVILVEGLLYLTAMPVGSWNIVVIQGRYFVPLLILAGVVLYNNCFLEWLNDQVGAFNARFLSFRYAFFALVTTYTTLYIVTVLLERYYMGGEAGLSCLLSLGIPFDLL